MKQVSTTVVSLRMAFSIAIAAHLIFLVGFSIRSSQSLSSNSLNVTIALNKHDKAPKEAKHIAAENQLGSGSTEKDSTPTTIETADFTSDTASKVLKTINRTRQEQTLQNTITSKAHAITSTMKNHRNDTQQVESRGEYFTQELESQEIKTLEAQLALDIQAYAKKPRIHRITSITAKAAVDAEYQRHWQERVEAVGNANYPQSAINQKLYGDVRLLVAIRNDGSIKNISVLKASKHKTLDQAAISSVKLAAPFAPFPPEITRKADILEIIRTWQFRNNQLSALNTQ